MICQDTTAGIFTIKWSSNKLHTVNFGTSTGEPFCVFKFFEKWRWESPPEQYKNQPHISSDAGPHKYSVVTPSSPHDTIWDELELLDQDQMELPTKTVSCPLKVYVTKLMVYLL